MNRGFFAAFGVAMLLATAQAPGAFDPKAIESGMVATMWGSELPFAPNAAILDGETLMIARLEGSEIRLAQATVRRTGLDRQPSGDGTPRPSAWITSTIPLSGAAAGTDALFGAEGRWFLVDEDGQRLLVADSSLQTLTPVAAPLPVDRIDNVVVADGKLFITGPAGRELLLAGLSLDKLSTAPEQGGAWQLGWPAPEAREGAALAASQGRLHLAGGRLLVNETYLKPRYVYRAEYESDGKPGNWQQIVQSLPREYGRGEMVELNDLLVLAGETPMTVDGATLTSQTLMTSIDRRGGYLSPWTELVTNVPLLADPVLVPLEQAQQVLVMGGRIAASGAENRQLWALKLQATPKYSETLRPAETPHPKMHALMDYRAALARANREGKFHLVFLMDDGAESTRLEKEINTDKNIYTMLQEMVLSKPAENDLADVQAKAGKKTFPVLVLLDSDAHVLGTFEGVPTRQEMFDLLKVTWGPKN